MREHIDTALGLRVKSPVKVGRSADGVTFCGYRVFATRLLLTRRRKRRYTVFRRDVEAEFLRGQIDAMERQRRFDAIWATTAQADAAGWRRGQLSRAPIAEALAAL